MVIVHTRHSVNISATGFLEEKYLAACRKSNKSSLENCKFAEDEETLHPSQNVSFLFFPLMCTVKFRTLVWMLHLACTSMVKWRDSTRFACTIVHFNNSETEEKRDEISSASPRWAKFGSLCVSERRHAETRVESGASSLHPPPPLTYFPALFSSGRDPIAW